ncbi:MAG: hypothetical protein J3K34DRAFT_422081 [Monoraphidium minutum]|nr:MAG: hypothetical protein J3K34DRAFT_422081 [Monoraphidium minutum]
MSITMTQPSDFLGTAVCDPATQVNAIADILAWLQALSTTMADPFGAAETVYEVKSAGCKTTPSLIDGFPPTAQWMYQVGIRAADTAAAALAAEHLTSGVTLNRGVCDATYSSLGLQGMYAARAARFAATGSPLEAPGPGPGGARRLMQGIPGWCTTLQGQAGAPAPFPCPNFPYRPDFTCVGALPRTVGCTGSPGVSASVAPSILAAADIKQASASFVAPPTTSSTSSAASEIKMPGPQGQAAAASTAAGGAPEPEEPPPEPLWVLGKNNVWHRARGAPEPVATAGAGGAEGPGPAEPQGRRRLSQSSAMGGPMAEPMYAASAPPEALPESVRRAEGRGIGVKFTAAEVAALGLEPLGAPTYYDSLIQGNDRWRGFEGLNVQKEGYFPIDAAVASSELLALNAINDRAAWYALDATGNASSTPLKTTSLAGLFGGVYAGTPPPASYFYNWAAPAAIHDKLSKRFVLAAASNVQTLDNLGNGWQYTYPPGSGVGGVYLGVSDNFDEANSPWRVHGWEPAACTTGYTLPDIVQVTYDAWGVFVSVSTLCATVGATSPGRALVYAFDKDAVAGLRSLRAAAYWDVTNGIGGTGASVMSVMPARPQGKMDADRDQAFFVAQNAATPLGGTDADAVMGVSVFMIAQTSLLTNAGLAGKPVSPMCMKNIFKGGRFKYFRDGVNPNNASYVPMQQPAAADVGGDVGPPLFSGLWTHMYAAAMHGTASDTEIWVANRAVGGDECEWAGPRDKTTCVPAIWYGSIRVIDGDVFFKPQLSNEEVVYNSLLSMAFPTVAVNSNGSVAIQFAYSSAYAGDQGIVSENGDIITIYNGVMHYGYHVQLGPANLMYIKRDGKATVQLRPVLTAREPPLSFGRYSSSDTVELANGRRRLYTAVVYAFNSPNWTAANLGLPYFPERGINNIGNFITVTQEIFG